MRAYLLGTLDADRRAQFEERLLSDPEVYEELRAVEVELIDESGRGELSELDQQQFQKYFAITAHKNIRFSTLLKTYADSHPAPIDPKREKVELDQAGNIAPAKRRFSFLLPSMGRPLLASAALVLAGLAVLTVWWVVIEKTAEQQALEQGDARMIEATLAPGVTRSAGTTQRVTVPPDGPFQVKLRLELTNASFNNYKSQLFRESKSLLTKNDLKMESSGNQQVVPVVIAGEILIPGDYKLTLSGVLDSGADEFIDNYSFRITTE